LTFTQVPDVTVEIRTPDGPPRLYLFDPKYKLDSDLVASNAASSNVGPKKEDVDKMHAYRDALRDPENERVVSYAGIMYPGPTVTYRTNHDVTEIAAISANPDDTAALSSTLRHLLRVALSP
jgi:predicted component of viral defense system (DUF524 family)